MASMLWIGGVAEKMPMEKGQDLGLQEGWASRLSRGKSRGSGEGKLWGGPKGHLGVPLRSRLWYCRVWSRCGLGSGHSGG